jgi:hypothetical protein
MFRTYGPSLRFPLIVNRPANIKQFKTKGLEAFRDPPVKTLDPINIGFDGNHTFLPSYTCSPFFCRNAGALLNLGTTYSLPLFLGYFLNTKHKHCCRRRRVYSRTLSFNDRYLFTSAHIGCDVTPSRKLKIVTNFVTLK